MPSDKAVIPSVSLYWLPSLERKLPRGQRRGRVAGQTWWGLFICCFQARLARLSPSA